MTEPKKFFAENVERYATSQQRPIEYNEQRGFLAMSAAIENIQMQLGELRREVALLHQEIRNR